MLIDDEGDELEMVKWLKGWIVPSVKVLKDLVECAYVRLTTAAAGKLKNENFIAIPIIFHRQVLDPK